MLHFLYRNVYRVFFNSLNPGNAFKGLTRRAFFSILNLKSKYIKIHITDSCNLQCKNCYCQLNSGFSLDKKIIFDLLGQIKHRNSSLHILGGEPLLAADILEIISYAKRRMREVILFTNGTLINDGLADKMKEAGLDAAIVTLHCDNEGMHDSITQSNGSWLKAIAGIKALVKSGVAAYSFTVLTSRNVGQLREIERLIKSLGAKTMYFPYVRQLVDDALYIKDKEVSRQAIGWIFNKSNEHKRDLLRILYIRGKVCTAFVSTISIKADGTVTPCPFIDLKLGNIKEDNLLRILYNSWDNQELLDFLSVPAKCNGCTLVDYCGGGCKAFRYNAYRDTKSCDCNCRGPYKTKISLEDLGSHMPYLF